jgi:uncharacterized membrane protein YozB (DUF420 family)
MNMGSGFNWNYLNSFLVQESISLMFVALGLAILGIGYARIKTKESMQLHRWVMSSSVILVLIATGFVMVPSLFLYYIGLNNSVTSGFSVLQIVHSGIGVPATILGLMYVFNDLPQPTKKWMRIAAVLWIASIVLGAVVYYTMPS